jgi:hypothetical protein
MSHGSGPASVLSVALGSGSVVSAGMEVSQDGRRWCFDWRRGLGRGA